MATRRELHVGSLITAPQDVIPLYNFLETYRIDGRITEINAVLTRNNLTAETVAALGSKAFGVNIDIQRVHVDDSNFDAQDKLFAEEFGFKIFSVAHIGIRDNMIEAWIGPTLIPVNHPLSQRIDSENSALVKSEGNKFQGGNKEIRPNSETISSYYVKLKVKDSSGVLAQVASEFGNTGISIREMRQPQSEEGSDATEMAFLLWPCVTHVLQSTLNSISRLNGVVLTVNRPLRAFNK